MPIKTTVITGATSGIGKATALELAKQQHAIYLLVRNTEKGEQTRQEIISASDNREVYVLYCDLTNLATVKVAADELKSKLFGINVLINNAGGIFNERELSADGFEMTFAANHLGHFLLTLSLMPLLERGQARIINLSSDAHQMGRINFDDLQSTQNYSPVRAYGTVKLMNILFTRSLAEKYRDKGITAFAVHPGVVNSGFGVGLKGFGKFLLSLGRPFMISTEQGAQTSIYLATGQRLDKQSGAYFKKSKPGKAANQANDAAAREQLWNISLKLVDSFLNDASN